MCVLFLFQFIVIFCIKPEQLMQPNQQTIALSPQQISLDVLLEKYAKGDETTQEEIFRRVCKGVASVEKTEELQEKWGREFFANMLEGAVGAGRIMSAAGTNISATLINCFTIPVGDSISGYDEDGRPGIYTALQQAAATMQKGGGVGYNFSFIRPKGSWVKSVHSTASGPCSYMDIFDASCKTIESAGSRRGAQMGVMNIDHPDILDFVKAKRTPGRWNNFNVSVMVTDSFMRAKANNEKIELVHKALPSAKQLEAGAYQRHDGLYVYGTIDAQELWDIIMKSNYDFAEPGILFYDNINNDNNLRYVETIVATNPCVTGDTVILTSGGYVRIDSVVDQEVQVWNGFEYSYVTPRVTGENQEIFDLEFSDGTKLACTPYHKFILADGSRVEAKDLQLNSKLAKFCFPVIEGHVTLDTTIAYTQGFYSGDGQKGTNRIWLYNEKCNLLPYMALSAFSDQSSDNSIRVMASMDHQPESKDFVPNNIYSIKTRLDWLAGLIDSDGSMQDKVVSIWSVDRNFLNNVKLMLNTLGASGTITLGRKAESQLMPNGKGGLATYECQDCWRIGISGTHIAFLRNLGLITHRVDITGDTARDAGRFIQLTFKQKRNTLESKVYCFTEDKNHSGIFNGLMTANCGEQPLPDYGCCDLGPIILPRFVRNPFTKEAFFDYEAFGEAVRIHVRFLDNVLDATVWPLPEEKAESDAKRRIGLGFTGLGNALAMLNVVYYEEEGIRTARMISEVMRDLAYQESVNLSIEKGSFPLFDEIKYLEEGTFASRLPEQLKEDIRQYGIRNSHLLSIAPTGTVSLAFADNASNGIEPPYSLAYTRKKRNGDGTHSFYNVLDHAFRVWLSIQPNQNFAKAIEEAVANYKTVFEYDSVTHSVADLLPKSLVTAMSMTVDQHLAMMNAVQPYIDTAISKTVNVPGDYPFEDFKSIYDTAWSNKLKGVSTYRPNSILGSVLTVESPKESPEFKIELKEDSISISTTGAVNLKNHSADVSLSDPDVKTFDQFVDEMYSESFQSRKDGMLQGITTKGRFFTEQGEQKFIVTINFIEIKRNTVHGPISIARPVEFILTSNFTTNSSAWDATMRFMSLSARSGVPIPKLIENLKEITWEHGAVRYGTKKKDGRQVPLWHASDVAAIGHAIQEALIACGFLDKEGKVVRPTVTSGKSSTMLTAPAEEVVVSEAPAPAPAPEPEVKKAVGAKCEECGAHAVIKSEGCLRCVECGWLGSCS